jgi:hypothetical protein
MTYTFEKEDEIKLRKEIKEMKEKIKDNIISKILIPEHKRDDEDIKKKFFELLLNKPPIK